MRALLVSAVALAAVACSQGGGDTTADTSAVGDWTVDSAQSRVAFVTVKNSEMAESHYFETVTGGVSADGAARFAIDLESVETRNDTRNERMREFLFKVTEFPEAVISAQLSPADFEGIGVDERVMKPVTFDLALNGAEWDMDAEVYVTRISNDQILVESVEPISVFAEDFDLVPGLDKLQELASLNSIDPVSPVTFSILLTR